MCDKSACRSGLTLFWTNALIHFTDKQLCSNLILIHLVIHASGSTVWQEVERKRTPLQTQPRPAYVDVGWVIMEAFCFGNVWLLPVCTSGPSVSSFRFFSANRIGRSLCPLQVHYIRYAHSLTWTKIENPNYVRPAIPNECCWWGAMKCQHMLPINLSTYFTLICDGWAEPASSPKTLYQCVRECAPHIWVLCLLARMFY